MLDRVSEVANTSSDYDDAAWYWAIPAFVSMLRCRRLQAFTVTAIITGAFALLAFTYVQLRPISFTARSQLLISNTGLQLSGADAVVTQLPTENSIVQTQIEIIRSDKIVSAAASGMGPELSRTIANTPISLKEVLLSRIAEAAGQDDAQGISRPTLEKLKDRINVSRVGVTAILDVTASGPDAASSMKFANALISAYLSHQSEANSVVSTSGLLRERIRSIGPNARLISEPHVPNKANGTRLATMVLMSAVAGLITSVVGLAVMYALTDRVRTAGEVASFFGFQHVVTIPRKISPEAAMSSVRLLIEETTGSSLRIVGVSSILGHMHSRSFAASLASYLTNQSESNLVIDATQIGAMTPHGRAEMKFTGTDEFTSMRVDNMQQLGIRLRDARSGDAIAYAWIIVTLPSLTDAQSLHLLARFLNFLTVIVPWNSPCAAARRRLNEARLPRDLQVAAILTNLPRSKKYI